MKSSKTFQQFCALVLMAIGFLSLAGCATTEDDNYSERPWNAPKTWESGIPQAMQQGR
jgi:hypothetical protein